MKKSAGPRVVSLLASATEIVVELGLEDRLVGISHECDYPERVLDRPRVSRPRFDPADLDSGEVDRAVRRAMAEHGSVYEIDAERLIELEPDLILTQAVCEVCAVPTPGVRDVIESTGLAAEIVSLDAHDLQEILGSVRDIAAAAGEPERAEPVVDRLGGRLRGARAAVEGAGAPRVLAIEWLDPPFAPGHWVPEMIDFAGGQNLVGEAGERSRQLEWSELEGLDPDVLLIMPCGYGLEAAGADADRHSAELSRIAPRAIRERRAFVVDASSYFNRSGPRVVTGVEITAGLLHPDRVATLPEGTASVWEPAAA